MAAACWGVGTLHYTTYDIAERALLIVSTILRIEGAYYLHR